MNKAKWHRANGIIAAFGMTAMLLSCSFIDEDLSDCDNDYKMNYELQLVTNITTELQTQLSMQADVQMATNLRSHLSDIFTDYAHDVDLSFYDNQYDSTRLHHEEHIMDDNQKSYALYLPKREYMHIATANIINNNVVSLTNDDRCHQARLTQVVADTIDSHTTGVFTARLAMKILEGIDQTFDVHLYMANCASALVIDTAGYDISNIRVVTTGFATDFNMADSTYKFSNHSPIVRANRVQHMGDSMMAFCSVNFPSPEPDATRAIIETDEPFIAQPGEKSLWEVRAYVTQKDGTITESVFGIREPLRAGQLKIIKARLHSDGSLSTNDQTVGVSITLNWNDAGHHDIEL